MQRSRSGVIGSVLAWAAAVVGLLLSGVAQAQTQVWTKVASEGATFTVSGTQTVRFGAGSAWVQKSVVTSGTCSVAYFGSDPAKGVTKECDLLGPAVAVLPPPPASSAPVVAYEYDAEGHPTKTTQAPGVTGFGLATQGSYDTLARLAKTTDAKAGQTLFGYDGLDRLTQVQDPRTLVTKTPRNGLGGRAAAGESGHGHERQHVRRGRELVDAHGCARGCCDVHL